MIAVFTNGNISQEAAPLENATGYTRPTMQLPKTMEGSFESAFGEIVSFIDSRYRTVAKKEGRAICGLSMGGFHTLYISLNNPDTFNYSGMFSAAIGVTDPNISPVYQDFDAKLKKYFDAKPALLWIGCGKTDFLYKSKRRVPLQTFLIFLPLHLHGNGRRPHMEELEDILKRIPDPCFSNRDTFRKPFREGGEKKPPSLRG